MRVLDSQQGRADLLQLVRQLTQSAPLADPSALLHWWPNFKRHLVAAVGSLNRIHQARARAPLSTRVQAELQLHAALAQLVSADSSQAQPAIAQYQQARQALAAAVKAEARPASQLAHTAWLHSREQPSRLITSLLHPPGASKDIAALRADQGGGLITSGPPLAARAVHHYATVSAAPVTTPAATTAVLSAVQAHATPLPAAAVTQASSTHFSTAEVMQAISASKPGTSPGPDGIPIELWHWCNDDLAWPC